MLAALLIPTSPATAPRADELCATLSARGPVVESDVGVDGDGSEGASAPYRASRREVILALATRLFRQHGFGRVGIHEIGLAADISGPAVYRHFDSKET